MGWVGSIQDQWTCASLPEMPLEARRSLFPDWPWLCDESSPHRRALHIPVQILAGKFKMEVLPTTSLTKAFPVAQICPNLHKIVPSSMRFLDYKHISVPFLAPILKKFALWAEY